jgi:hypothetical protein
MKSKIVNLNSFSLPGFILPTFQKAKLRTIGKWWYKKQWLLFSYYEHKDISTCELKRKIIRIK